MNKILRQMLCMLLLCAVVINAVPFAANAIEVPDMNKKGSITVKIRYEDEPWVKGKLTLYCVGDIENVDENYGFVKNDQFAAFPGSVETVADLEDEENAENMEQFIKDNNISGTELALNKHAKVTFTDLEPGLYFVRQTQVGTGYSWAKPFFVSLPMHDGEAYIYDVVATPKTSVRKSNPRPTPTPTPSTPPEIPNTGVAKWPIPLMAVTGLAVFTLGWCMFRKGSRYE